MVVRRSGVAVHVPLRRCRIVMTLLPRLLILLPLHHRHDDLAHQSRDLSAALSSPSQPAVGLRRRVALGGVKCLRRHCVFFLAECIFLGPLLRYQLLG